MVKLGCLNNYVALHQKSYFTSHQSQQIFLKIFICTHGGLWVPITTISNSKVVHSYTITENIFIVSNFEKLVCGNLISLFLYRCFLLGELATVAAGAAIQFLFIVFFKRVQSK